MKKTELTAMSVAELKALASKMDVTLPAGANKTDIVEALSDNGSGAPAGSKKPAAKKAAPRKPAEQKRAPAAKKPAGAPAREWKMPPGAEEPLMAQEKVAESKFYTGPKEQIQAPSHADLPYGYGEEKIALMVRDPYTAHAYWESTQARLDREKAWFGWNSKLSLRIYDVTGVQFTGQNAIGYFDQEVYERLGNWYFDLGRPTHTFCADLGLLSPEGRFLTLARSNYITMPRDGVSDVLDEEWMLMDEEFWKLYGFPAGSSPGVREMWKRKRMQEITSPGMFSREKAKRK